MQRTFFLFRKVNETILLEVIAGRFLNESLQWNSKKTKFQRRKPISFWTGSTGSFDELPDVRCGMTEDTDDGKPKTHN